MEHNRHCDTVGEVYGNSESADFPLNVDNNRHKNRSQSDQYNGITIFHQKHTQIAEFSVVTPEQSKHIKPVDMAILSMIPQRDPDLTAYLNELLRTKKRLQQDNTFWFPIPENPGKPEDHTPIQTRILNELEELKDKEKLNQQESRESWNKFLKWLDWTDTLLTETEKQALEDVLVEYHGFFARQRTDIGMNTEFKVKLTPKDDKAVYSQSLPLPIHLKEDLIVDLALMQKYGSITVLPFSKYASPIFARMKPNGKLHLLVDLRKRNSLIADDYTNNNHPVSTLSDAAQHLAVKSLFCKLDCSQAYHCLQMADQRSVEMFAFSFAIRTFAYKRLTQGLSRSVSAFFKFHAWILGPSRQSWPMCSIRRWHWNCSQQCHGPYPEHSGSLQVHSLNRIEAHIWKMSFWSQTSWVPRGNNFTRRNLTANSKNSKLPWKT